MGSFFVKMRVTEVREYLIEAKNADEAAARAESGEAFMHEYAHCHTLDWEVCDVKRVRKPARG